jgi:hypothetical protein
MRGCQISPPALDRRTDLGRTKYYEKRGARNVRVVLLCRGQNNPAIHSSANERLGALGEFVADSPQTTGHDSAHDAQDGEPGSYPYFLWS